MGGGNRNLDATVGYPGTTNSLRDGGNDVIYGLGGMMTFSTILMKR